MPIIATLRDTLALKHTGVTFYEMVAQQPPREGQYVHGSGIWDSRTGEDYEYWARNAVAERVGVVVWIWEEQPRPLYQELRSRIEEALCPS